MSKFLRFGLITALLFVFILPSVFPVTGNPEGDANPSIKNVDTTTYSIVSDEERKLLEDEERKANERFYSQNPQLLNENTWVTIQDIQTTESKEVPHTAFNPVVKEELKEGEQSDNKWVSIKRSSGTSDDSVRTDLSKDFSEDDIKNLPAYPKDKKTFVEIEI